MCTTYWKKTASKNPSVSFTSYASTNIRKKKINVETSLIQPALPPGRPYGTSAEFVRYAHSLCLRSTSNTPKRCGERSPRGKCQILTWLFTQALDLVSVQNFSFLPPILIFRHNVYLGRAHRVNVVRVSGLERGNLTTLIVFSNLELVYAPNNISIPPSLLS